MRREERWQQRAERAAHPGGRTPAPSGSNGVILTEKGKDVVEAARLEASGASSSSLRTHYPI